MCCSEAKELSPRAVDISDIASFGCGQDAPFDDETTTPLRLVTYNIHGWRDTFHNDNLDRLIALLSRLDADVIALQEVLHPYRPPADPAERAAYFDRVNSGMGNGFEPSVPSWGVWGDGDGDSRRARRGTRHAARQLRPRHRRRIHQQVALCVFYA